MSTQGGGLWIESGRRTDQTSSELETEAWQSTSRGRTRSWGQSSWRTRCSKSYWRQEYGSPGRGKAGQVGSPGGVHGQHHAGGVRGAAVQGGEVRPGGLPNFNPNYFLISILTKNVEVLEDDYK